MVSGILNHSPAADPTDVEQYMLELINWARANPTETASVYGVDLNEGLDPGTISTDAKQPLAMNSKLTTAARYHTEDMFANQYLSHTGSAGNKFYERIKSYGYNWRSCGENIAMTKPITSAIDETQAVYDLQRILFQDEGFSRRGHRRNILDPEFREIGIGGNSGDYEGYNAYIVTQDFGLDWADLPIVLGIVYRDLDGDGFYTPGEGIRNVTISSQEGSLYGVTSSSGGYAIEVFDRGTYVLTASGSGINLSKTVTVCDKNLKVDFIPPSVIPDIKVNSSDGPITLNQSDILSITVALDNNGQTKNADWWLAADTPFGLWFFTFEGWTENWQPGYQCPLFYLDSFEALSMPVSGLPAGIYTIYFGIDTNMDGNVTWDSVYYNTVKVNVTK